MTKMRANNFGLSLAMMILLATPAWSAIEFDQNVTTNVIMGSGIGNGGFTTDRDNGVELGLRAKLRHNAAGQPEGTYNSDGSGRYFFKPGVAPTQAFPTAEWSFEWSINSDWEGTLGRNLDQLTYQLSLDNDPSVGVDFFAPFDPINGVNPGTNAVQWDHSIGDNSTAQSGGAEISNGAVDPTGYADLINMNNLAQNSWKPHWFIFPFDPTVGGVYDFQLEAFDGGNLIASTSIQVITTPEPVSFLVWSMLGIVGVTTSARRRRAS